MNVFLNLVRNHQGNAPLGSWIMSASPLVAEAMGHAGFEWAVVDMEHTPLDMMEVIHILQAVAGTKMLPVVRVDRKSTRLNSSHSQQSRMPSSA